MTAEQKIFWSTAAVLVLVAAVLLLGPSIERSLGPEPVAAWVAIEIPGRGVAEVGRTEIEAGTPFTLHAVLEAAARGDRKIYFTEAKALRIRGREVPAGTLRRWGDRRPVRILWFTVEGLAPYLEVTVPQDLRRFRFVESFRPEWPRAWSIPGSVTPSSETFIPGSQAFGPFPFGTQRYHVRIELFEADDQIAPTLRLRSPGAGELPEMQAEFPTVVARLAAGPAHPSGVFGLTQIATGGEPQPGVSGQVAAWTRQEIAFSRAAVLRQELDRRGISWEELGWKRVDLAAGPGWGAEGARAGDLVRVGERIVFLYRDREPVGRLGYEDLCFDYDRGAAVRTLEEIFTGGGLVEWASLAGRPRSRQPGGS